MAPTRKSRSVNKRYTYVNEVSPSKGGEDAKKSTQRKRKLSDLLGSQWSKEELERFYEAYRKYGENWKKVAAAVRNRSVQMVEALYTMNKAYLSLPEGTASVVGLIAMMTDHYCNLAGSESEQESDDGTVTSNKPQKRGRGKFQPNTSKGSDGRFLSHSQPVASGSGCLSLLKKRRSGGTRPRAVGKRTPRFPVAYSYDKASREKFLSTTKQGLKRKMDGSVDDVAHEVALTLAEASQRRGSPQVSQTPSRRTKSIMSSPIRRGERMHAELELKTAKLGSEMDEDGFEGSLESMEADNGDFARDRNYLLGIEGYGTEEARKGRWPNVKKLEDDDSGTNHLEEIKEACSGTEEGQHMGAVRAKLEFDVRDGKVARSSSHVSRKKSKKVPFKRDEGSAFDALQTLADLSLMMPETATENESSPQLKEEEDDVVARHERDRPKSSGVKRKGNHLPMGFEDSALKTANLVEVSVLDGSTIPEGKEGPQQSSARISRKKQKTLVPKPEGHSDTQPSESQHAEARDTGKILLSKGKRSSQNTIQQKQGKSVRYPENSASSTNPTRVEKDDSALSTVKFPKANHVSLPTKVRSRRKMELQKPQHLKDLKTSDKFLTDQHNLPIRSGQDGALNLKEKLSNCLSNPRLRRWSAFEWFYSAVDYPWFAKREFVEYLNHVGLGHVPRLTRVEWGVIRSSLGKPRRFSEQFLREEKEKLNQYRESVRTHYSELRAGTREGLPTDLARPLSVGQRVVAIHPRTREIHDGSVLTVDHTRCRVQFDRPELGVEFVLDVDCMPSKLSANLPTTLARNRVPVDKCLENLNDLKTNDWAKDLKAEGYMKFSRGENLESLDVPSTVSPSTYPKNNTLKQAKGHGVHTNSNLQAKIRSEETANNQQSGNSQPSIPAHIQAKDADVQALAELTRVLDKKEAVVSELGYMNDDVFENLRDGDKALRDSEPFKKQYAAVLVQLNEVNEQVSSSLCCLRQRNTYQENSLLTFSRATGNFGDSGGSLSSFDQPVNHTQESGSHVHEIVESSRLKAQTMVDAAMQAMASLKGGGNTVDRIEEAIDYVSNRLSLVDSCTLAMGPALADPTYGTSPSPSLHAPEIKLKNMHDRNEAQIPSELIGHCVATLLMIQKCTERESPPADVAQILDSAVTGLQPCCSQNLPVYDEIQKCMGIIRNQIMALIPS